jgi:hypothetical protein
MDNQLTEIIVHELLCSENIRNKRGMCYYSYRNDLEIKATVIVKPIGIKKDSQVKGGLQLVWNEKG